MDTATGPPEYPFKVRWSRACGAAMVHPAAASLPWSFIDRIRRSVEAEPSSIRQVPADVASWVLQHTSTALG